jgi:hypothetical protein
MKNEKVEVRKLCLVQAVTLKIHHQDPDDSMMKKSVTEIAKLFEDFIDE